MVWTLTTRSTEPSRRPFLRGLAAGGLLGGLALAAGSVRLAQARCLSREGGGTVFEVTLPAA